MTKLVQHYLSVRRAAGYKLEKTGWRLDRYARFAEARGDTHIKSETAVAWAATARSPHARYLRLRELVLFAHFLRAEDPAHEVPPGGVFPSVWQRRPPHVYSDAEVGDMLRLMGELEPHGSQRPATYVTLFGLLTVTGMRIQEALDLRIADVSAEAIVIRDTKFRKSRWLPLHPTTTSALTRYRDRWRRIAGDDAFFFVSANERSLYYWEVLRVFLAVTRAAGIRLPADAPAGPRRAPRIHDLRHTFAVRALEAAPEGKGAVDRHMLALSTYLGHTFPRYTYGYLHSTPQLLVGIADACEALDDRGPC